MSSPLMLLLAAIGFAAGCFGAIAGIGGGIILTPLLVLYFDVPMHQAIGTSLICVVATSTATSSVQVERHVANVRLGMTLELATTIGAAMAAMVAAYVNRRTLAVMFACFLLYSATALLRRAWRARSESHQSEIPSYEPHNYPAGMGASFVAGGLSGLLGIGGGPIKVPVMYLFMGVPLRAATATSNFMIGVTAATSAYIYYGRGDVALAFAVPLVVGVFAGSLTGARLSARVRAVYVMVMLIVVTVYLAVQMLWKVWTGALA